MEVLGVGLPMGARLLLVDSRPPLTQCAHALLLEMTSVEGTLQILPSWGGLLEALGVGLPVGARLLIASSSPSQNYRAAWEAIAPCTGAWFERGYASLSLLLRM